jgi:uncharacterized protein involved in exopolysaccharide biosynthesis
MRERGWTGGRDEPSGGWGGGAVRTRYSAGDLAVLLWRERLVMLLVFAALVCVGVGFALTLPRTWTARTSLGIKLGAPYVYQPAAGDAARGAIPQTDQVVQSEIEILSSDALKRRVVARLGLQRIEPKLAAAARGADGVERRELEASAVKALGRALKVETAPDTGVVRVSLAWRDPDDAALILNTLVEQYLDYRREVFADVTTPALARQKLAFESRLAAADAAYEAFLQNNGVSDFATEKQSLAALYQNVLDARYKAEAQVQEAAGKLAALKARMTDAPREIEIQRDLDLSAPGKLLALRVERQDLLSRYRPDAQPVKDVDAKIAALEALVSSPGGVGDKDRRLGANPVWQDLETQRIQLEAEVASAVRRRDELARQLAEVSGRQLRLTGLESQYQSLAVERDVLQTNLKAFTARQAENRAADEIARGGDDSVRVFDRAEPPTEGTSLRKPAFVLALLFAAFTAVCAGLLRVFLRPGFATAGSAGRTLELPVLATAPLKTL